MDEFFSFFDTQSGYSWSYDTFKNFHQISPVVQTHLKQVYLTLCCEMVASAVGAYLHLLWNIGGLLTALGVFLSVIWLAKTPIYQERKRVVLLMSSALLTGASIGALIELAIYIDRSILVTAFVGSALAFGCLSAAAVLSRRREYLYLGGLLASGLSMLLWLQIASSFFGSVAVFEFELYMGLLLFVGYVVFDTQVIIERAHLGDLDYVAHSLLLFTDFAAIFVRVLGITLKNSAEKRKKKRSEE